MPERDTALAPWLGRVHTGDAIAAMRLLPPGCVDFVFTDPPYGNNINSNGDLISRIGLSRGIEYQKGSTNDGRPIANDGPEANDLFRACLPEWFRLLQPGCCCCCCCGGGGPDPQFARWALWMDEVFAFKQMVVWDKGPIGMGWHYRWSYETVLVGEVPGAACRWYDTTRAVENIIRPGNGIRRIVLRANQHPTEKPVELARHFIRLHTKPGDVVLDCFAGSGSTLEACVREGRRFVGIELDPHWAGAARKRIAEALAQPVFDFGASEKSRLPEPTQEGWPMV